MKKLIFTSAFFLLFGVTLVAQKSLNSYKYILVPKQYEFQKTEDAYQVNSLTKFLFNKAGFNVLFNDEPYPEDLVDNVCLGLKAIVKNNPSLLATKMKIDLVDCYNNVVYSTTEGKSKIKEYKKAYHDAIRKTFADIEALDYKYESTTKIAPKALVEKNVITNKTEVVNKTKVVQDVSESKSVKQKSIDIKSDEIKAKVKSGDVKIKNNEQVKVKKESYSIEGVFNIDSWGRSTITKKNDSYSVKGGDEDFEFATIYPTSKPTLFIIKWVAYKQPQMVEIDKDGNLNIDSETGVKNYKRLD